MWATEDIIVTASRAEHFGVLIEAIAMAGLTQVLASEGPYTLFAPTDDAFAEFPNGELEALFADPTDELIPLVLYHLVPGKLRTADLADGVVVETAEGGSLRFSRDDGLLRVNGVRITNGDIEAANGVIHVITQVLALPVEDWGLDDCCGKRAS
jgi:uncharacterized surface protein with fasciclin (FAS1) repeats